MSEDKLVCPDCGAQDSIRATYKCTDCGNEMKRGPEPDGIPRQQPCPDRVPTGRCKGTMYPCKATCSNCGEIEVPKNTADI